MRGRVRVLRAGNLRRLGELLKDMLRKNEVFEGVVEGLGSNGEGIIKCGGTTVFVPFCLVGERVRFKIVKTDKNCAYGKLESVLNAAYARVNPPCPVFFKCGGCDLQHMDYCAQLGFKRELVKRALLKTGGIDFNVGETVPCGKEFRYRNKLALPIGVNENGETALGFYGARSHRIIPIEDCLIQSEWVKKVVAAVLKYSKTQHIAGYNEVTREGVLRKIVVRELDGRFIFALVAAKRVDAGYLIKELERDFGEFTFLMNINASDGNAIFGKEWHICRGEGHFEAVSHGIKYVAGANTFVQVNDDVREKLYSAVLDNVPEGAVALDLYSGGGLLTAMLAKKCGKAFGVEIVEEASRCADELAAANGLRENMTNVCGKVEEKLADVLAAAEGQKRVIVCDPPRKGMERRVVNAVKSSGAEKVVLVSCNPATLARDLGILCGTLKEVDGKLLKAEPPFDSAYEILSVTPYDMFPQTKHVETLVVLGKK